MNSPTWLISANAFGLLWRRRRAWYRAVRTVVMNYRGVCPVTCALSVFLSASAARADYSNTVISFNPVAYWPLNEGPHAGIASNRTTDNPNIEAYFSGGVTPGVAGAIAAETNTAVAFDGSTGWVTFSLPQVSGLAASFSVEGWFKPASADAACTCSCGTFDSRWPAWVIYYHPPFGWNLRMHKATSPAPSLNIEGGSTSVGVWHHIVATCDGTNGCLYVDGSPVGGPASASDFAPSRDSSLTVAARGDHTFPFNGSADEVAFYTNALPAPVIQAHYENGTNHNPSEPYASMIRSQKPALYYRLDEPILRTGEASFQLVPIATASNYSRLGASVNGICVGGTRWGAGPPFHGFGSAGFACEFDQNPGGYVDCTTNAALNITGPITAIAWIKAKPGVSRFQTFLGRSDKSWRADVDAQGIARWANGRENPDAAGTRVNDGMWHFFAGVYDGIMNYVYVDAKLEGAVRAPYPVAGDNGKTLIGSVADYPQARSFQGSVAQVAVFTNALSADDILRIYRSAEPTPPPGD